VTTAEAVLQEALAYTRSAERIICTLSLLKQAASNLAEIHEIAPDALPELSATNDQIIAAAEALGRAHDFLVARLDVKLGRA
jgi:hypothetical protein